MTVLGLSACTQIKSAINYDQVLMLDAEALAESGIKEAYLRILPQLTDYVHHPLEIEEIYDDSNGLYAVRVGQTTIEIYGPQHKADVYDGWGRATYALFKIVNDQLSGSTYKFYALNDDNDLSGIFLREEQVEAEKKIVKNPIYWPYIPTDEAPWFGKFH